jgi:hypothetical protein
MGETGLVPLAGPGSFAANPAVLPWAGGSEIGLGYARLVEGLPASATSVSAVMPFGPKVVVPGPGEIGYRFGLGFCLDHSGVELSQGTDWGWNLISIGIGYRVTPYVSAGFATKYLFSRSDLDGSGVTAYAADLGGVIELTPRISFGIALRNLIGSAGWDDGETESPPVVIAGGAGFVLPYSVTCEIDGTVSNSIPGRFGLGFDVPFGVTGFNARVGYIRYAGDYSRSVVTAGFGYRYESFTLDYALKSDDEVALGTTHHFTLTYSMK